MKFLLYIEKFLAILFWGLMIFGFDVAYIAVLTILAALIHELGHITAILFFTKCNFSLPRGNLSGFRINIGTLSYKEELIVAAAGPLINLILGIVFALIKFPGGAAPYFQAFCILNFMTMISNLFPIDGYDGYKILSALTCIFTSDLPRSERILNNVSFIFSTAMCFASLYIMLNFGEGYWIFGIFITAVISFIFKRQKSTF